MKKKKKNGKKDLPKICLNVAIRDHLERESERKM